jgi:hypothetical protein
MDISIYMLVGMCVLCRHLPFILSTFYHFDTRKYFEYSVYSGAPVGHNIDILYTKENKNKTKNQKKLGIHDNVGAQYYVVDLCISS